MTTSYWPVPPASDAMSTVPPLEAMAPRILLADDDQLNHRLLEYTLRDVGAEFTHAMSGEDAVAKALEERFDLILLDMMMPGIDGLETCRRLKADEATADVAVIFMSAVEDAAAKVSGFDVGAVDYITKPFHAEEVVARVSLHLRLRALERERAIRMTQMETRDAMIVAFATLAESRDDDTGAHLERIRLYTRTLAREMARHDDSMTSSWIDLVVAASALHDIGKVGVPDAVLLKPGKLTSDEIEAMRLHTMIGGGALLRIQARTGPTEFLVAAREIAWHHHERWDGAGYPEGLSGEHIPLAARIVALADVYDALTSRRVYKPAMTHAEARQMIIDERGTHFDPRVVDAFMAVEAAFERVAETHADRVKFAA